MFIMNSSFYFHVQFAASASGSDLPNISEKLQLLPPSGASFDRFKSRSVGSGLDVIPPPKMVCMQHKYCFLLVKVAKNRRNVP